MKEEELHEESACACADRRGSYGRGGVGCHERRLVADGRRVPRGSVHVRPDRVHGAAHRPGRVPRPGAGNWAKYSLDSFNAANGTHFTILQGDTQLNPKLALTVGTKFAADKSLLVTVGPAGLARRSLPSGRSSSGRACRTSPSSATNVDADAGQVPDVLARRRQRRGAGPLGRPLHGQQAARQEGRHHRRPGGLLDRSRRRGDGVLKANDVTVQRESVNQKVTDFSSLVTKVPE